jgi:hypothetical protein
MSISPGNKCTGNKFLGSQGNQYLGKPMTKNFRNNKTNPRSTYFKEPVFGEQMSREPK